MYLRHLIDTAVIFCIVIIYVFLSVDFVNLMNISLSIADYLFMLNNKGIDTFS